MEWELKSLTDKFETTEFNPSERPVIVGSEDNKEKVLYVIVDNTTLIRSDSDTEKEEELSIEDLKSNKFDKIPEDIVTKFLEVNNIESNEDNNKITPENKSSNTELNKDSNQQIVRF